MPVERFCGRVGIISERFRDIIIIPIRHLWQIPLIKGGYFSHAFTQCRTVPVRSVLATSRVMNTDLQNKHTTCRKKKTFFPFRTLVSGHSNRQAVSDIYAQKHKADTVIIRKVSQNLGEF